MSTLAAIALGLLVGGGLVAIALALTALTFWIDNQLADDPPREKWRP